MGRTGKGALSTKGPNKKQKAIFSITNITKQYFGNLLKKFDNSPFLDYKSKEVHNEPTEDYLFLMKYITKLMKSERHVQLHTKFVKLVTNETIGHVNKAIQPE